MRRVDVEVLAKYQLDGKIIPVSVKWGDGRTFEIEQVLDIRPASSTKSRRCRYSVSGAHRAHAHLFVP